MLQAVLHGKIRENLKPAGEVENWRDVYCGCEDFLTAAVFSRLTYLPVSCFWSIFTSATGQTASADFTESVARLCERRFWPNWTLPDGNRVQPDVYLEFEDIAVIVEAKLEAETGQTQNAEQWAREICAYRNSSTTRALVFFWAIGGLGKDPGASLKRLSEETKLILETAGADPPHFFAGCSWGQLLDAVLSLIEGPAEGPGNFLKEDLMAALDLHGIRRWTWISDLPERGSLLQIDLRSAASTLCAVLGHSQTVTEDQWVGFALANPVDSRAVATMGEFAHGRSS